MGERGSASDSENDAASMSVRSRRRLEAGASFAIRSPPSGSEEEPSAGCGSRWRVDKTGERVVVIVLYGSCCSASKDAVPSLPLSVNRADMTSAEGRRRYGCKWKRLPVVLHCRRWLLPHCAATVRDDM